MEKIKNIVIFIVIIGALFLAYIFFMKGDDATESLVSSASVPSPSTSAAGGVAEGKDFLNLLLSVKSIQLNDALFSDIAFESLDGSHSITLVGDGSEGRPNPFAPFGAEVIAPPLNNQTSAPAGSNSNVGASGL